jgi:hypothetical protein
MITIIGTSRVAGLCRRGVTHVEVDTTGISPRRNTRHVDFD